MQLRAVNAILTSLDRIRSYPNALIISTSNMLSGQDDSSTIDAAFLSRCDMKVYIGHPEEQAVYEILRSCVKEMVRIGAVSDAEEESDRAYAKDLDTGLVRAARELVGSSGRLLRKIPVLAYMKFSGRKGIKLDAYLSKIVDMYGITKDKALKTF